MNNYLKLSKNLLALGLCVLVASDVMTPAAYAQSLPARIELIVVEGEGVINDVHQRTARNLAVKVEDDDHRPVAGASVVFALPISDASGEFPNGSRNLTAVTNQDGLAVARGLRTNQVPGKLQIYVTASYRGLGAKALITQFIEGAPATVKTPELRTHTSGGKWKWIVLGIVVAGGAGGGVYFGTRTSSSSSPISITTGPLVFGSPR
ncbi:MAG TPA: hypothetical protein VE959_26985 [Bryobacteraceae bacterium]|nr:hypothetical protein [Bryobacteraceae bacterium]